MPAPTPKPGTGTYLGLGRYSPGNAWRLDEVMRLARENGVYLMFCLGTYGEFTEGGFFNEGCWVSNPYNARNGGPCRRPADFWTSPEARKLYQRRLRYLIARWGSSPTCSRGSSGTRSPQRRQGNAWVGEMAAYLKQHDPYRHLVSTTYGDAGDLEDSRRRLHHDPHVRPGREHRRLHAARSSARPDAGLAFRSLTCWPSSASTGRPATSTGTGPGAA